MPGTVVGCGKNCPSLAFQLRILPRLHSFYFIVPAGSRTAGMEIIHQAPEVTAFVPLIEHQSITPASFYSGPPVLHYHSQRCKVIVVESDMLKSAAVQRLAQGGETLNTSIGDTTNGVDVEAQSSAEDNPVRRVISNIDVWVTSEWVFR